MQCTVIYLESGPSVFLYPRELSLVKPVLRKIAVPEAPTQVLNVAYGVRQDLHLGNPQIRVLSTGWDFLSEFIELSVFGSSLSCSFSPHTPKAAGRAEYACVFFWLFCGDLSDYLCFLMYTYSLL